MPEDQIDLTPGEHLVLGSNPHWWFFWKEVLETGYQFAQWRTTRFTIPDRRVA